jgi:hypothetical protein
MTPSARVPSNPLCRAGAAACAVVFLLALGLVAFGGLASLPVAGWTIPRGGTAGALVTVPSTRSLERLAPMVPEAFEVEWAGYYVAQTPGLYTFVLDADDEAALHLAGEQVIELRGAAGIRRAWAARQLPAGVHPVRVTYRQLGGAVGLRLFHRRPFDWYTDLSERVFPTRDDGRRWLAVRTAGLAGAFALGALAVAGTVLAAVLGMHRFLGSPVTPVALRTVLVLMFVVLASGVGWGLPGPGSWAPDELVPSRVLTGMQRWFSSGWYDIYPPGHYYLLSLALAPFAWLWHVAALDPGDLYQQSAMLALSRVASVALALASIWLVYVIARALRRPAASAIAAATIAAASPLFLYYGRTANVDMAYVAFVLAVIALYVRLLEAPDWAAGHVTLGVCAAWAVAAKDQSYAFLPGIALHLVGARVRHTGSLRAAARERPLWLALAAFMATGAVLFNLAGNWDGVVAHVASITGPASTSYRLHPGTLAGQAALALDVLRQFRWSLGWAATLATLTGVVVAARRGWPNLPLVVPALSYLLGFTAVVGYSFDRFLLVPVALACVAAGTAVGEWWTGHAWGRTARALAVVVVIYSAAHGLSVAAITLGDSRYSVERWLLARVPPTANVGWIGEPSYLPRLLPFGGYELRSVEDLTTDPALRFVVINRALTTRKRAGAEPLPSLYEGTAGFERVLTKARSAWLVVPWEWMHEPGVDDPHTNISKISPLIDVFERVEAGR